MSMDTAERVGDVCCLFVILLLLVCCSAVVYLLLCCCLYGLCGLLVGVESEGATAGGSEMYGERLGGVCDSERLDGGGVRISLPVGIVGITIELCSIGNTLGEE